MHEMSIVSGILKIAENKAKGAEAKVINSIELEIGQLAGIEIDSLQFCYDVAKKKTMACDAELIIKSISGRGFCSNCKKDVPVGYQMAVCPDCQQAVVEIFQGRELRVISINVD